MGRQNPPTKQAQQRLELKPQSNPLNRASKQGRPSAYHATMMKALRPPIICLAYIGLPTPALCLSSEISRPPPPPPIVACRTTSEVQRAVDAVVRPGDSVLELGAQLSGTSAHLCRAVGPAIGGGRATLADVQRRGATTGRSAGRDAGKFLVGVGDPSRNGDSEEESFRDRVDHIELERFDEWRTLTDRQYDAMVLDVGATIGNDLHLSALAIADEFAAGQRRLRATIVKSKALSNLARRTVHSQRLLDGTVKLPSKNELAEYPDPLVIPCVGVSDYRSTIPFVVERGDEVIEVGCHYGTTTELLHDAAVVDGGGGFCAGVDVGERIIENARGRYPEMTFEVADAWNTLDLIKLKQERCGYADSPLGYDVVYADIGGLSGAHGLLESLALLDAIGRALEPRCIVIKSACMKKLASRLIPISKVAKLRQNR